MEDQAAPAAWLEGGDGARAAITGAFFIGRSANSSLVLAEEKVSRRHAMVQCQGGREFWLVDLGSANGTYLNGRRIVQPSRLGAGDIIRIGDYTFTFRTANDTSGSASASNVEQTVQEIKSANCWLLVADLEGSTQWSRRVSPEEVSHLTGRWLNTCKDIVETHGGAINKFLGDGFLAYWHDAQEAAAGVASALQALAQLQAGTLPFRVVAHFGKVFIGGGASLGEESLVGSEVNFVFRMEKLAGVLGVARLLSEPARSALGSHLAGVHPQGRHPLSGFDSDHAFYGFGDSPPGKV